MTRQTTTTVVINVRLLERLSGTDNSWRERGEGRGGRGRCERRGETDGAADPRVVHQERHASTFNLVFDHCAQTQTRRQVLTLWRGEGGGRGEEGVRRRGRVHTARCALQHNMWLI